jgi:hypothetical protein
MSKIVLIFVQEYHNKKGINQMNVILPLSGCNSIQTIALFGISLILIAHYKENFEDTEGVIRSRKSKKERQYNGPKKMDKRWTCRCVFATTLSRSDLRQVGGFLHQ